MSSTEMTDRVGMFYRSLSMDEAAKVHEIKERGQEFIDMLNTLGTSSETTRAKARVEEAVMWAVKHVAAG